MKKVLLFTPPYNTGIIEITGNWPPAGLLYIAGALEEAGFAVRVCDLMVRREGIGPLVEELRKWQPDAVVTGAFTPAVNAAVAALKKVKEINPATVTVLGGVHPTFCYRELLEQHEGIIDYIVRGEGEATCPQLLLTLEKGGDPTGVAGLAFRRNGEIVVTEERPLLEDLDRLRPAWHLLEWERYYYRITGSRLAVIVTSRGCRYTCRFCSQHLFWRGCYRVRSPRSVVEEILILNNRYGVGMCMLADEYPTADRERWEEILDRLIAAGSPVYLTLETRAEDILRDRDILNKYRRAGVIHVYVGVEAAEQERLDYLGKESTAAAGKEAIALLNEAGIVTECSFILGGVDETPEKISQTLQQALDYNPDLVHFLLLTPWPYTPLYEEVKERIVERNWDKYHFVYPIIQPQAMTVAELWTKLLECYKIFYRSKMSQLSFYRDPWKRQYMERCLKIMLEEFFQPRVELGAEACGLERGK